MSDDQHTTEVEYTATAKAILQWISLDDPDGGFAEVHPAFGPVRAFPWHGAAVGASPRWSPEALAELPEALREKAEAFYHTKRTLQPNEWRYPNTPHVMLEFETRMVRTGAGCHYIPQIRTRTIAGGGAGVEPTWGKWMGRGSLDQYAEARSKEMHRRLALEEKAHAERTIPMPLGAIETIARTVQDLAHEVVPMGVEVKVEAGQTDAVPEGAIRISIMRGVGR